MTRISPLRARHAAWAAAEAKRVARVGAEERPGAAAGAAPEALPVEYLPYGAGDDVIEIPAAFGPVELEYGALRRGAVLLDLPQRGVLRLTGDDRIDFLDRLLTQALKDMVPGELRTGFLLSRQGRIAADALLVALGDATLLELDAHQASTTASVLDSFLFSEDVAIEDATEPMHRLGLVGRQAAEALAAAGDDAPPEAGRVATLAIAGASVVAARADLVGEPGFELFVAADDAERVAEALLAVELDAPVRPCGWFAWNIARVEHGVPLFNIDFGATSLPHESGLLRERVSFNKGCYPGQEVVARMENLGQPKQVVVGLQVRGDVLPVEGSPVHGRETGEGGAETLGPPVGVITSSTLSPMLGRMPIALATVKTAHAKIGESVLVTAEGQMVEAVVAARPLWTR